jgi:hypothetical protein
MWKNYGNENHSTDYDKSKTARDCGIIQLFFGSMMTNDAR